MRKIRAKLTYANVTATLALFLALSGGVALAASHLAKNSVGPRQLKKNAVTTAKIRNGAVTGSKVKLATLGKVPSAARADAATSADALQGLPAAAFVKGGGQLLTGRAVLDYGQSGVPVLQVPGIGPLEAGCTAGKTYPEGVWRLLNQSGTPVDQTLQYGPANDGGIFAPGDAIELNGEEYVGSWTMQVATRATPPTVATLTLSFDSRGTAATSGCTMIVQVLVASP